MHHTTKLWGTRHLETYFSFCLHSLPQSLILQQSCATAVLGTFLFVTVIVNHVLSMGLENKSRLNVKTKQKQTQKKENQELKPKTTKNNPINIWCRTKVRLQ